MRCCAAGSRIATALMPPAAAAASRARAVQTGQVPAASKLVSSAGARVFEAFQDSWFSAR